MSSPGSTPTMTSHRLPSEEASPASTGIPAIIAAHPSSEFQRGRTIVVCLDGTGDRFDNDNSNVVNLYSCLVKSDHSQPTLYQAGIGTYSGAGSLKSGFAAASDMAVGSGLGLHVRDAYLFLMRTYRAGDRICIFGFSRGAYTARCLCAMLHKVGLLPPHNEAQLPFAYSMYKDDTPNGWALSADFKKTFSSDVSIAFLGLWDTVASVGIVPRTLPYGKSENSSVAYVRHALALDERRSKFKSLHWFQRRYDQGHTLTEQEVETAKREARLAEERAHNAEKSASMRRLAASSTVESERDLLLNAAAAASKRNSASLGTFAGAGLGAYEFGGAAVAFAEEPEELDDVKLPGQRQRTPPSSLRDPKAQALANASANRRKSLPLPFRRDSLGGPKLSKDQEQAKLRAQFEKKEAELFGPDQGQTDVLEVWFAGAHADVGGGAVANEVRHKLSNIPLRWMIRQTFLCNTGILYHAEAMAEVGLDVHSLYPVCVPRSLPICGPPPSAMDRYAQGHIPPRADRRHSIRRSPTASTLLEGPAAVGEDGRTPEWLPEDHEDYFDALSDVNDQLKLAKGWWILEFWPVKRRIQTHQGGWAKRTTLNLGRHRTIRDDVPKLHHSVKTRMEATGYRIRNDVSQSASFEFVI